MKTFKYSVRDPQGRNVHGVLEMEDRSRVFTYFRERNYRVISIDAASDFEIFVRKLLSLSSGISRQDVVLFMRQLSTLVRAGLSLAQSLESLACTEKNQRFREVIVAVKEDIEKGNAFSEALSRYPNLFSQITVGLIQAGEAGSMLDEALERIAQLGLQELEIRTKLQAALTYPIILVGVALLVVGFLLIGAVPKFLDIFRASQAELPLATVILLTVSNLLRQFFWAILLGLGAVLFAATRYYQTPRGRMFVDRLTLRVPIFGDMYMKVSTARLTRTVSGLTKSGIPLLRALEIGKAVTENVVILDAIDKIRVGISQGKGITELFERAKIFPPMVIQMVSVGESTGKLDEMLEEVAKFYELELEYFLRRLTSSLEPVLLLFMGLLVGFIALAVLMPVFNLVKVFRQ